MTKLTTRLGFLIVTLAASSLAVASDFKAGDITIAQPWARATPPVAQTGAGYLTLTNTGDEDEALLSVSTPISKTAEIHTQSMEDHVMVMREVQRIDIPSGGQIRMEPASSLHMMFIGLKAPLEEGQTFPLTLTFEQAGEITVEVTVRKDSPEQ